jgi:hypothetical protein
VGTDVGVLEEMGTIHYVGEAAYGALVVALAPVVLWLVFVVALGQAQVSPAGRV